MRYRKSFPAVLLIGVSGLSAGCQSLDLSGEELAWQSLHAVDIVQTLSAADDPCYVEDAFVTRQLIGSQPNAGEVLAWGVGMAVGHAWISALLKDRDAPGWVRKTWSYVTIAGTGIAVAGNHAEGVRMFGANKPVDGCSQR